MSSNAPSAVFGSNVGTLIVAALFTAHIVKMKKALKARKTPTLPNMVTQVFVYMFLAGAALNILFLIMKAFAAGYSQA
jgi:cell shape-determining protein MreD